MFKLCVLTLVLASASYSSSRSTGRRIGYSIPSVSFWDAQSARAQPRVYLVGDLDTYDRRDRDYYRVLPVVSSSTRVRDLGVRDYGVRDIGVRDIGVRDPVLRDLGVGTIGNIGMRDPVLRDLGVGDFGPGRAPDGDYMTRRGIVTKDGSDYSFDSY